MPTSSARSARPAPAWLLSDVDVAGAISTAWSGPGPHLFGVGGTPEGVLAAALKCMAAISGRTVDAQRQRTAAAVAAATTCPRCHTTIWCRAQLFFAATGITDGDLLKGVRYHPQSAITQSLVMRSRSGTVRLVDAHHAFEKLTGISAVDYS